MAERTDSGRLFQRGGAQEWKALLLQSTECIHNTVTVIVFNDTNQTKS